MADSKPINWAYPFKSKAATEGETSQGSVTAESYYDALAKAKDGFYPMGANGLWHGGIHFDDGTAASLDQSAIHCIADGEVIAYRIDQRYPTTQYGEGSTVVHLPFSTGFVLVKHRLELPPVPVPSASAAKTGETKEAVPAATTPTAAAASSALTFYSLYMHLADWASYSNADAPTPPAFFGETLYSVKADKASDGVLGLRVRAAPKDGAVTALLPKGTKVKVGDADAKSPAWRKLLSILEGSAIPALTGEELGWVYTSELQAVDSEADTFLVADDANDAEPTLAPQTGLNVRKTGNGKNSDPKTGLLPIGAKCSLKAGTAAYRELQQIVEGQDIAPLSANSVHNIQGFVHFASLQASQAVPTLDTVHLLPRPYPIKAGELVGHLGKYQNFDDARPRSMLHLEVFTSEDVPAFLAQSRAVAQKLPAEQKTLIKVHAGSSILQPSAADAQVPADWDVRLSNDSPKEGCWAKVQQYAVLKVDKSALDSYASAHKRYALSATQKSALATQLGVAVGEMPDNVDFLLEYYDADGSNPQTYTSGSIPAAHPMRKIGIRLTTAHWVERAKLNDQGGRRSTSGTLTAWTTFPLQTGTDGQACGYDRILPGASWAGLAPHHKAIAPDNTRWWYVTVGDKDGKDISGWVPEIDPIISKHSPWEWPGFSTLQDKLPLDAHLARTLDATGRATEEETQSYAALIEEAERGAILSKLYDVIDLPDEKGARDNKLTPAELKTALGKPWLAQQLSLLISQHESEWFWNEGKWNQLDKLMDHTPADPNPDWVAEKGRIKALSWWKELAGQPGIAADGVAWHFQPVSLLGNLLSSKKEEITVPFLEKILGKTGEWFTGRGGSKQFIESFKTSYPNIYKFDKYEFVKLLNAALVRHGIITGYQKAHFLAQCFHESAHFETTIEFASGEGYNPGRHIDAEKNGNTTIGDGPKYKGKGLIQLTWKNNYKNYSDNRGVDFVGSPDLIASDMFNAIDVSCWYWRNNGGVHKKHNAKGDINVLIDHEKDNVTLVTLAVNGGDNGLTERKKIFEAIKKEWGLK